MNPKNGVITIIGVGNEHRGDDGVGIAAARKIASMKIPDYEILESNGDGPQLIEVWKEKDFVIIIDAVKSNRSPGTIHVFDNCTDVLSADFITYSSHAFGLAEAIALSSTLNTLPQKMLILGIEAKDFSAGNIISPECKRAVDTVVKLVTEFSFALT